MKTVNIKMRNCIYVFTKQGFKHIFVICTLSYSHIRQSIAIVTTFTHDKH